MTDSADPPPIAGGAVSDDDDDFGSFEDAVTGTENGQPDDLKSGSDSKANGSSSLAGGSGGEGLDHFDSAHSNDESSNSPDNDKTNDSGGSGGFDPSFSSSLRVEGNAPDEGAGTDEKKEDEDDSSPSTHQANGDPFGAFDSIPAVSLPKTTVGGAGDDPFTAFDSLGGAPTTGSHALIGEANVGPPEKDGGAGDASPENRAESAPKEGSNGDDDGDDDGFGSFDDAVMVESPEDKSTTDPAQEGTEWDEKGGEFGAFSGTAPSEEAAHDEEHPVPERGEEATPDDASPDEEQLAPENGGDAMPNDATPMEGNVRSEGANKGDNDFGDFGAFEDAGASAPATEPIMEPVEATKASDVNTDSDDNDFGDFNAPDGSPPAEPAIASSTEEGGGEKPLVDKSEDEPKERCDEDDFCDFGSFNDGPAEPEVSEEIAKDAPVISKPEGGVTSEEAVAIAGDDDFGEFGDFDGGASELQSEETKEVERKEEGEEAAGIGDTGAGDDDFGDFGSFNGSASPEDIVESPSEKAAEAAIDQQVDQMMPEDGKGGDIDGESFGDFGSFNESPTSETTANAHVEKMKEKEEQGDGVAAAALEEAEKPSDAATQPVASANKADENNDDDDFDDFGDFDEAPAAPLAEEEKPGDSAAQPPAVGEGDEDEDDFGDFGDFDDAGGISEAAAPEPVPEDPLTAKSRAVLERVFRGFPVDGASSESPTDDLGVGSVTLESVLSSIAASPTIGTDTGDGLWSKRQMKSILSDLDGLHSAPPSVISNHDIPRPYSHYAIPMGGLHLSEDGSPVYGGAVDGPVAERIRGNNSPDGGRKPVVPEVLSINLPTGPESPPPPMKPPAVRAKEAATVVALPGVGGEEKAEKAAKETNLANDAPSGEGDFDADFGGFASAQTGQEKTATQGNSEGDGDFDADFGGFESAKDSSAAAAGGDDSVVMSASCKDFLRQIPNLSFMLKSTLSLPTGSDRP